MTDAVDNAGHMDRIYRWQVGFYDLTRKYYLLGRDRLIAELQPPALGSVMEVGCGTGRNLILAARAYPDARFYGFDISDVMLGKARKAVERAGLADRIVLAKADAATFDPQHVFGRAGFDRVFCSYTLSMIPPWQAAIGRALAAVLPGGRLHIVDFGLQDGLPAWFRRGLLAWLRGFSVEPRGDLRLVLDRAAQEHGMRVNSADLWRGYAISAVVEPWDGA
jgi:S-adenosylmethionine-diacylgycerolhomoserine-N-methlytransferase